MAYQYTPIHTLTEPAVGLALIAPGLLLMAACSFPRARYFLGPRSTADVAPGHLVCGVAAAFLRATTAPVQWRSSVLLLLAAAQPPRLASPRLASPRLASPRLASPRLASPRLASHMRARFYVTTVVTVVLRTHKLTRLLLRCSGPTSSARQCAVQSTVL